jgi:hypothetical protein
MKNAMLIRGCMLLLLFTFAIICNSCEILNPEDCYDCRRYFNGEWENDYVCNYSKVEKMESQGWTCTNSSI